MLFFVSLLLCLLLSFHNTSPIHTPWSAFVAVWRHSICACWYTTHEVRNRAFKLNVFRKTWKLSLASCELSLARARNTNMQPVQIATPWSSTNCLRLQSHPCQISALLPPNLHLTCPHTHQPFEHHETHLQSHHITALAASHLHEWPTYTRATNASKNSHHPKRGRRHEA